ncbi:MAG: XRE family transcriptional regulator [Candidatus Binataceae bacterium]
MSTTVGEEEFRRRLRLIMQQFGSVADLARAVGVSDNAIYKWVSGRGQPSMISLVNLARAARVSIEWLATGQDAPKGEARGPESSEYVYLPYNSVRGTVGRGTVQSRQIVDYLAFKAEWIRRRIGIEPKSLLLVEAVSDSMAPTIDEGDLALVDLRDPRFRHDGVYVLWASGELSIKRIQRRPDGKLIVRNDNPAYEPTVVAADNVNVVGHVIWIAGKL